MLPVTYGYAWVSKADDEVRNLETQLGILADHGIREDLIFSDIANGRTMNRTGWLDLISRVQPGDTIVVAFLDRFSRNFEDGVRIQAELTGRDIGIVAVRENINTSDGSAAAKFFRRSMLAQGAYQVGSASERDQAGVGPGSGRLSQSPFRYGLKNIQRPNGKVIETIYAVATIHTSTFLWVSGHPCRSRAGLRDSSTIYWLTESHTQVRSPTPCSGPKMERYKLPGTLP